MVDLNLIPTITDRIVFKSLTKMFYLMYPVFRDVKASGLYFLVYSYTLDKLRVGEPSRENTGPEIFFAGGMAGRSNHECLSRILERLVNNFRETKLYISYETKTTIGVDIV